MKAKDLFAKGWATRIGFYLGKYLPPRGGRFVAGIAARIITTLKPGMYRAVYDNQQHVLSPEASPQAIRKSVYHVFFNAARAYYELFHNVGRGKTDVKQIYPPVYVTPESAAHIQQALDSGRGVFFLGCHMSNFDLGGIALSQHMSIPVQTLSVADPPPGFEFFNDLRTRCGAWLTPITPQSLHEAMRRLEDGGAVITGVDRPIAHGNEPVEFFGARACLPTGYIRIPLRTNALVLLLTTLHEEDEYRVVVNPPLEMIRTGDKEQDIQVNLRRVLAQVEDFIRRHPEQWMMFLPVWKPECPDEHDS